MWLQGHQDREAYVSVLRDINNQAATLILGMFALLAGLAIVNTHNLWVSGMSRAAPAL
jgi:hypothetical protein